MNKESKARSVFFVIALCIAVVMLGAPAQGGQMLWGSSQRDGGVPPGALFTIDTLSGNVTKIGTFDDLLASEIEYDPATGTLYASETNGGGDLHIIDPTTAASLGSVFYGVENLSGLEALGPFLAGTTIVSDQFVLVDPATGFLHNVGPHGLPMPITGLAFDRGSGILYGSTSGSIPPSSLVTINAATGAATPVGSMGVDRVGSIEYGANRKLYGGLSQNATANAQFLLEIDTTTGAATPLFDTGFSITGLTLGPSPLTISPPSGTFAKSENFDITLLLELAGGRAKGLMAAFNGKDISPVLQSCLNFGTLTAGGLSFRCPDRAGRTLPPGTHTLEVSLRLADGSWVSDAVVWEVLNNTE